MKHAFNYIALASVIILIASTCENLRADSRGSDTVLIVPARPGVLKLAFDFENMRDITIVSFRGKANSEKPLMYVWIGKNWHYVSFDDFCSSRFISKTPEVAIIIGDDKTVPKALLQGMAWPCKVERLQTLNAADLINGMDKYFQFSKREWKRLAGAYGLQLKDVNTPKREFNPYNIPRSKMPLKTHDFKQDKDDVPPAVLIEKPDVQSGN
ncbi:hypothetical protein ACFLQL_02490 [Verrucomicrobiota bacterium]